MNNAGAGIALGNAYCTVTGNVCGNNGQILGNGISLFGFNVSGTNYTAHDCIISNNNCFDNQGTPTQGYGYGEFVGSGPALSNNVITDNIFAGNKYGSMNVAVASTYISFRGPQLYYTTTWNPNGGAAIANGASVTLSLTVTNAAFGDTVKVAFGEDNKGCVFAGYVSAANTVVIVLSNTTGAAQTFFNGNLNVWVEKPLAYTQIG
jgi:hypothetical protein